MKYNFENKLFLVTGGSGFLGVPLVKRLLADKANVRVISRDEGKLIELKQQCPQVEILNGDISDAFDEIETKIHYFKYTHPRYSQNFDGFLENMSVIDLLMNCGEESLELIQNSSEIVQ